MNPVNPENLVNPVQGFEKLGVFYLGRTKTDNNLLLYDSKDLVTHAVCVGMTGSGKTGLCITLLEEAAIDGIPAIIIDPKGDLCNLLLTFPNLAPEDFAPWTEEGVDAAQQAKLWKEGLAKWGEDGERIKRLREAADFRIYTPGSNAGLPVSVLKSFAAPPETIRQDGEALAERINTTVTSLLALIGVEADPVRSREHILLSNILNQEWSVGRDLDIAGLIQKVQSPSITRIGVMDLDSFFPAKDRFDLAMALNHLLASPSFASWMEGEALDVPKFLHTHTGKPRLSIFSIAHLADAERMFFVSLLLNQVLGWMRTQSGTTSLRAILYMDEIFGYFPPVANPPSKLPLLTLLKQGRAFGLGVVLATQNPVDLDYKGLANTGTWFIGRLQTERDKARVLDGLEGIASGTGQKFDKQGMEQLLAGLDNRIFLLNNVHEDTPEVFETRWAMSYLRGPLTRTQIKLLMDPLKASTATPSAPAAAPAPVTTAPIKTGRPILPPEITEYYIPARSSGGANASLTYHPMLLGAAEVRYSNSKTTDVTQRLTLLAALKDGPVSLDWSEAVALDLPVEDLESESQAGAAFVEVPADAAKAKSYAAWSKDLASWIYRNQRLELLESPTLNIVSNPGETERDFRVRLQQIAREQRDEAVEKLRRKYAPKFEQLEERKRRAEQAVARETEQAKGQKMQTAISFGATLLSSFLGRKRAGMSTLGRATTAVRGVGRSMKEAQDVGRAEENVASISQKLADLQAEFQAETAALERSLDPQTEPLEKVSLKPTKANIAVKLVTLAWAPYWHDSQGTKPAWE
jgi:Helicase HerA, central domain